MELFAVVVRITNLRSCRRFIADQSDFSEENILNAGIEKRFQNINLDDCVKEIANYIKSVQ